MHTRIMLTMTPRTTRLGQLIRERRQSAGLSQEELAERIHAKRDYIASIETGRTKQPSPDTINAIARVLSVTVAEMVRAMGYGVEVDDDLLRRAASDEIVFPEAGKSRANACKSVVRYTRLLSCVRAIFRALLPALLPGRGDCCPVCSSPAMRRGSIGAVRQGGTLTYNERGDSSVGRPARRQEPLGSSPWG